METKVWESRPENPRVLSRDRTQACSTVSENSTTEPPMPWPFELDWVAQKGLFFFFFFCLGEHVEGTDLSHREAEKN